MHFARLGPRNSERPFVFLPNGEAKDISSIIADLDPAGIAKLHELGDAFDATPLPKAVAHARYGSVISRPGKVIGIGLNYRDHALEAGLAIPAEPIVFFKSPTSLAGASDDVPLPYGSKHLDWEIELGVVIGGRLSDADEEDARAAIFGFCIANDISERDWQFNRGGSWDKGKSHDGFCPLGPHLVPRRSVKDPGNLSLRLAVNEITRQSSNTSEMIFDPIFLVSYVSRFMRLEPGDVILTGTPAGVGIGIKPQPTYLAIGDTVSATIQGLGQQEFGIVARQ